MSNEKRLTRSQTDKMIGGVCGGIGEYFNIDPTLVRIGFAALVLIGIGSPLLLYLLLWIIMPAANSPRALTAAAADPVPVAQLEARSTETETETAAPAPAAASQAPTEEIAVQPSALVDTDTTPHTEPAADVTQAPEERVVQM